MSWSFTVNGDNPMTEITPEMVAEWMRAHLKYPDDMQLALNMAREIPLKSFTCTGGRTENPYTHEEMITIAVMGSPDTDRINEVIRASILKGPDDVAQARRDNPVFHEDDSR